jgi:hypothetical protein
MFIAASASKVTPTMSYNGQAVPVSLINLDLLSLLQI